MSKKSLKIDLFNVKDIKFTKDNARKITDEALADLKLSIEKLGIIRPLIINGKNELISGNQRTKTLKKLGVEKVPVVIIKDISISDYIGFALLVNSIEHNKSKVIIDNPNEIEYNKFISINTNRIKTLEYKNPVVRRDIANSIIKHGQWGNAIINEDGEVIFNSDYASTMETIGYPLTVYKVNKEQEAFIKDYLFRDYGVYSYDHLDLPSFPQTYVQPSRTPDFNGMGNAMRSILYDEIARKTLENGKNLRYVDFGSGKKFVPNYYRSLGYNIDTYEPFYKVVAKNKNESTYFDLEVIVGEIKTLEEHIKEHGLYDVVMCEAVLNSTISKKLELYVIATCNALMNKDGVLYISSRSLKRIMQCAGTNDNSKTAIDNSKRTFELDENGMYLSYRKGYYTAQKYHDEQKLKETLLEYFEEVEQRKAKNTSSTAIYYECRKPRKIDEEYLLEVLNEEFNLEYPNKYRHNQHYGLVESIIKANRER